MDLNCKRVIILDDGLFQYGKVACTDVKYKKNVVSNEQIIQDCGVEALKKSPFKPKYEYSAYDSALRLMNNFWIFFFRLDDKCLVRIVESEELWWFRAQCLRVNDLKAQVLLLDSGKVVTVMLDNVREFDEKCDFPPRTTICRIKSALSAQNLQSHQFNGFVFLFFRRHCCPRWQDDTRDGRQTAQHTDHFRRIRH